MKVYLALDGTADVDQAARCKAAARIGYFCLVCVLPADKDPDDLSADELEENKADARPVLDEWLDWIDHTDEGPKRSALLKELARHCTEWRKQAPEMAGEMRNGICAALGFSDDEYDAWMVQGGPAPGRRNEDAPRSPEQPARDGHGPPDLEPLGAALNGDPDRPVISNFYWETRWKPDPKRAERAGSDPAVRKDLAELKALSKLDTPSVAELARRQALIDLYGAEEKSARVAKTIGAVRQEVQDVLRGWPHRIRSVGASKPLLFLDRGGEDIDQVADAKDFLALLKDYAHLKFNSRQDADAVNYVTPDELFRSFGRSERVREWLAIEQAPFEPPMPGHYVQWKPPVGYKPTGRRLGQFLSFFDNLQNPGARALMAASILTPFWGGPYGKRPAFIFDAPVQGSGKTTAATLIARIVHRGGAISINLDRRSDERLKERLLSPEGMVKRVCIVDNVKGSVSNELLEELVTCTWISGKRLAVGEASRPNTLTYYVTANNARLSTDMTRRAVFIRFQPLTAKEGNARASWEKVVGLFMADHCGEVVADCLAILAAKRKPFDWKGYQGERFPLWVEGVLAAALQNEYVQRAVGKVDPIEVLASNQEYRDATDEDLEEARVFMDGLLERVCAWKGYTALTRPDEDVFIRTYAPPRPSATDDEYTDDQTKHNNMVNYWMEIFTRSAISAKWLTKQLKDHIEGGRLAGLEHVRTRKMRGWVLSAKTVEEYVSAQTEADCDA